MASKMHALERLSLRTSTKVRTQDSGEEAQGHDTEHDLDLLLGGERAADGEGVQGEKSVGGGENLQELLLRLRLGSGSTGARQGRYKEDDGKL